MQSVPLSNTTQNPPQSYSSFEAEYEALRRGAGLHVQSRGVLRLSGAESVDFLQRLSTNDMAPLSAKLQVTTVLTTEKAKIVDVCTILPKARELIVVTSEGTNVRVKSWLEKFIIMEDIQLSDITDSMATCSIFGFQAKNVLSELFSKDLGGSGEPRTDFNLFGHFYTLFEEQSTGLACFHLLSTRDAIDCFVAAFSGPDARRSMRLQPVGTLAFESFRIEQGLPAVGRDITEEVNPLEASLRRYVSFTKGCYIGQEVIARIDTYSKLQKELRGVIIDAPQERMLAPGAIWSLSAQNGVTTSHSWSFTLGRHIAIGYVKTAAESSSVEFREGPTGAASFPATIAEFPLC